MAQQPAKFGMQGKMHWARESLMPLKTKKTVRADNARYFMASTHLLCSRLQHNREQMLRLSFFEHAAGSR
jgi:hypothetical protein